MRDIVDSVRVAERAEKYDAITQRWREKPEIAVCEHHEWHMDGRYYSCQLYCKEYRTWVNPSGVTCDACRKGFWPAFEYWRTQIIPRILREKGRVAAENATVRAVETKRLSPADAVRIANEIFPD